MTNNINKNLNYLIALITALLLILNYTPILANERKNIQYNITKINIENKILETEHNNAKYKISKNYIFIPQKNELQVKKKNKLIWHLSFKNTITSGIKINKNSAFLITNNKTLKSINKKTGKINWKLKIEEKLPTIIKVTNKKIFISTFNSKIIILNTHTGKKIVTLNLKKNQYYLLEKNKCVLIKNNLYIISNDGKIKLINKNTGNIKWEIEAFKQSNENDYQKSQNSVKKIIKYNNTILISNNKNEMTLIKMPEKKILWKKTTRSKFKISRIKNDYLITKNNGKLTLVNGKTGKVIWKIKSLINKKLTNAIFLNKLKSIIIGEKNGTLYSINYKAKIKKINIKIKEKKINKLIKNYKENIYLKSSNAILYIKLNKAHG